MKRLVQDIGKQLLLLKDLLLTGVIFMCGMFLLGIVLVTVIMSGTGDHEIFLLGSTMVLMALLFNCFFSAAQMVSNYNYAIAMGQTRRQTIPAYMIATFLVYLIYDLVAVLLHLTDRWLMGVIFPELPQADVMQMVLRWRYLLLIALAGTAVTMLMGAAITRFGRSAYFVFWCAMMICFIGLPRGYTYLDRYLAGSAIVTSLQQMAAYAGAHIQTVVITGGLTGSVICIVAAWLMLRRQQVMV